MDECEGKPRPDVILMDFEKGMNEAFRTTFSDSLIRGCAFHWLQLLRRRMGEDGLLSLYNNEAKFQLVIHQIWGLMYVRTEDIARAWESVVRRELAANLDEWKEEYDDDIRSFFSYFDRQWIGALNPRTGQRKRPMYPAEQWNMFAAVQSGGARTNNALESYNKTFFSSLPNKPSVWALIDRFVAEEALSKKTTIDLAMGIGVADNSSRTMQQKEKDDRLAALVGNVDKMSLALYMEAVVSLFNN